MLTNKRRFTRSGTAPIALLYFVLLSGCGGKAYQHADPAALDFRSRAETQVDGAISVSAVMRPTWASAK